MNCSLRLSTARRLPCLFRQTHRAFSTHFPRRSGAPEGSNSQSGQDAEASSSAVAKSSIPAGTTLRGLNILKNGSDPVALEDSEYPSWLWTILTPRASASGEKTSQYIDPTLTKKQRKRELKRIAKEEAENPSKEILVPLHHQTIDLPASDGRLPSALDADEARMELRRALRQERRGKIKETNFLKTMS